MSSRNFLVKVRKYWGFFAVVVGILFGSHLVTSAAESDNFFFDAVTYSEFNGDGKVDAVARMRDVDVTGFVTVEGDYKVGNGNWQDLFPDSSLLSPSSWIGDTGDGRSFDLFPYAESVSVKMTDVTNGGSIEYTLLQPTGERIGIRRTSIGDGKDAGEVFVLLSTAFTNNADQSRGISLEYLHNGSGMWEEFSYGAADTTTPGVSTGLRTAFDSVPCSAAIMTTQNNVAKYEIKVRGRLTLGTNDISVIEKTLDVTNYCAPPTPTPSVPSSTPSSSPSYTPTPSPTLTPTSEPTPTPTPIPTPTPTGGPTPTPTP